MDISSSQYSSVASESGWTHYLDQSYLSEGHSRKGAMVKEEEDLSMVSDASSGPPHYYDEDDEWFCVDWYNSTSEHTKGTEKKKRVKEYSRIQQPSPLDDTASSPFLKYPKARHMNFSGNGAVENALNYSQSSSATRVKKKPKFQKHFSFFKRSLHEKQASEDSGDSFVSPFLYI
ncbi:unnamed protein product [Lupinus luteus]|uniref:Uncharacterized protein n=1 Tax=Lupinus luteus TaxID=3873 RepID=A0AAV1XCX2_LUPLU